MSKPTPAKIVCNLAERLRQHGFSADRKFHLKRERPFLNQYIEIQPGMRSLAGKFAPKVGWQFSMDDSRDDETFSLIVNVGFLSGSSELWLDAPQIGDEAQIAARIEELLLSHGIPFLDDFGELQKIIAAYESAIRPEVAVSNPSDPRLFFGPDEGWMNYQLGFAHNVLGDSAKAHHHFATVVNSHSDFPAEWVQKRKSRCLAELASLG